MKLILPLLLFITFNATAQQYDTTYQTYSITHDTIITTTIPEQYICHDSDVTVLDTFYNIYYENQIYATANGSVETTIQVCDTIPAHDTTFIKTNGAIHDTTVMILVPIPPSGTKINAVFNAGNFTWAYKLNLAKELSNNGIRENNDEDQSWQVKQTHDSGLINLMTYNAPSCCTGNAFYTGTALQDAANTLNQHFLDNPNDKPDIISFNNEEPNRAYWEGTAQSYVNTMNTLAEVAHSHGVPCSNGGILQNVIYYIRWVYQQEGKTDSVNLINARANIGPNTGTAAQELIDWYKVEIPAIAASDLDYVNFHWYEPAINLDPGSDTTTGLVPIVVNFLRSRTGKPVINTEFGMEGNSRNMFNQLCDELDDSGVDIRVYYNGTGPISTSHPDWWEAWILSQ